MAGETQALGSLTLGAGSSILSLGATSSVLNFAVSSSNSWLDTLPVMTERRFRWRLHR